MARRCEFYVLVARTISHSFAAATHEHKIHSNTKFMSSRHRVISSIYFGSCLCILSLLVHIKTATLMTACVAEARDVGEGERERGKKERGLGQRRSAPGSCSRRSFPFILAFFLTYFIHVYACNSGYTYYNYSQPLTSRRRVRIVLSIYCIIVSFTMM